MQLECWDCDREGSLRMESLECCLCVGDQTEGEHSEIVGEAASCSVVVQTSKSGIEWASAVQRTEG